MKECIACGMPMTKPADFACQDESKEYCVHCARPDGAMHSFEEKRAGMADFIVKTQGLDREVAQKAADNTLSKLPAWKAYYPEQ